MDKASEMEGQLYFPSFIQESLVNEMWPERHIWAYGRKLAEAKYYSPLREKSELSPEVASTQAGAM